MKYLKPFLVLILGLFQTLNLFASAEPEMADAFRSEGKIYVVVAVILLIFIGLALLLFLLDRRIQKLENEQHDSD
jgi:cytochrome c biogenesis factor